VGVAQPLERVGGGRLVRRGEDTRFVGDAVAEPRLVLGEGDAGGADDEQQGRERRAGAQRNASDSVGIVA
jgi:hypothetical protein